MRAMTTTGHLTKNDPASNLRSILDEASAQYKELTGRDLATHPFAAKFDNWDSVDAVLDVFQDQARKFNEVRKGNEKLMEWLRPMVQVSVSISASLGNVLSTVGFKYLCPLHRCTLTPISQPFPPAQAVFTGISVLLSVSVFLNSLLLGHITLDSQAAVGVVASYEVLVNLFESVHYFLLRLKIYTDIPLTTELTEILGKIMAEIIFILALGTKEFMRKSISE